MATIDTLSIDIKSNSKAAVNGINALITSLSRLKSATRDGAGLGGLNDKLKSLSGTLGGLRISSQRASGGYVDLWAKMSLVNSATRKLVSSLGYAITESNKYIEDLNLFTVSMGEYADDAQRYAEKVSEVMGIDPAQFMRNQGVFMTISKGFGVSADRAAIMSKNLTQLGYDLSSFFNISYEDSMKKLTSAISGELEPIRRLGYDLSKARLKQEALNLGIHKSFLDMTQAEKAQLRYHAIMTQVTAVQGDMARTLDAPSNQLRVLSAQAVQCARAFGNIFIPALNAVLPVAIAVMKVLRGLAESIAGLFGFKLPKVDMSSIKTGAAALGDMSDAAKGTAGGLGKAGEAAKKLKNSLLGIDELNVLSKDSDNAGSGRGSGGAGGAGGGSEFDFDLPTYDFLGNAINSKVDKIKGIIEGAIKEIMVVLAAASLVIGIILVATGANIPLGLGLIAIGAYTLGKEIAVNWDSMSKPLADLLHFLTGLIAGFALAVGAVLVFTGANIPLGVALMVLGAVSLAASLAINWYKLEGKFKGILQTLDLMLGAAFLTLGAILTLTGVNIPLGIALLAKGALDLVSAADEKWDFLPDKVRDIIAGIDAVVGIAFLTLGAVIAFSGVNIPLGIGLLATGALQLATMNPVAWERLPNEIKAKIAVIEAIIGLSLLFIGTVLALSGINVPLGIGLMAGGAIELATTSVLNWNQLSDDTKRIISDIEAAVGGALLAIGAILAFSGANILLGLGMIAIGAVVLASAVGLNWDKLNEDVVQAIASLAEVLGTASLVMGAILAFSGFNIPLGIVLMGAGAALLVTAAALNWNKLPAQLREALTTVLVVTGMIALVIGIILVMGGLLPLGIALIAIGATSLFTAVAVNWNFIKDKIQENWGAFVFAGVVLVVLGILLCFATLLPLGIGLIAAGAGVLATAIALTPDGVKKEITNTLDSIKKVVDDNRVAIGLIMCLTVVGLPLGIGLLVDEFAKSSKTTTIDKLALPNLTQEQLDEIQARYDKFRANSVTTMTEAGRETVNGYVRGISERQPEALEAMRRWGESASSTFKEPLKIHSPSKVFYEHGENTVQGFANGISERNIDSRNSITSWAENIKEWFIDNSLGGINSSTFSTYGNDVIEGFRIKINSAYPNSKESVVTWANSIREWFTDSSAGGINNDTFQGYANNTIDGFKEKIGNSYTNTEPNMNRWANEIKRWFNSIVSEKAFGEIAYDTIKGFKNEISSRYTDTQSNMETFGIKVKGWFTQHASGDSFYKVASDVIDGFKRGIGELYSTCKNSISNWGSSIISWFKDTLDVNSPSKKFYEIGKFTVDGFNLAISKEGKTSKEMVQNWAESFTNISPKIALLVDTSEVENYNPVQSYSKNIPVGIKNSYQVGIDDFSDGMEKLYKTYIEPKLNQIADDMKRQADRQEQTIVQVGNRTIAEAVTTQRQADGYVFTV